MGGERERERERDMVRGVKEKEVSWGGIEGKTGFRV